MSVALGLFGDQPISVDRTAKRGGVRTHASHHGEQRQKMERSVVSSAAMMPETNTATEETTDVGNTLMLRVQQGDTKAVAKLVELYNNRLFNFLYRILGDTEGTQDVVQETWLSLYERRQSYQPTFRFSTWLFTIGRRKALSELRRRSVRSIVRSMTRWDGDRDLDDFAAPQRTFTDPEAATDGTILRAMVEQALSRITPNQREIVMLRDIEGLENEEIAEVLGWNLKPGAIRKRVFDAREAFRKAMIALGYREE